MNSTWDVENCSVQIKVNLSKEANGFNYCCNFKCFIFLVVLHNQFLLAILNKVDILEPPVKLAEGSTPSQHMSSKVNVSSKKRRRAADNVTFEPAFVMEYIAYEDHVDIPPSANPPTIRYAVQEMFLPDAGLVMGRLLVAAWEIGLVSADETAVELIVSGVQILLKNILTSVIGKRKHYKTTSDAKYFYDVGVQLKDPFVRNTVTRQKIDDDPLEIDKEISSVSLLRKPNEETQFLAACEEHKTPLAKQRISKFDLYTALSDRNVIPSHSVYSVNIEKISNMLT